MSTNSEEMPPKRKRTSLPEAKPEEPDTPVGPSLSKKRKKSATYDPIEIIQELYDTIRNHKTEDGRLLCEAFIRVPKRRTAADYYEVVTTPIDLLRIQQKLKTDEYEEIDQLTMDMDLMLTNARAYYKKNSQEYRDAVDLADLYTRTKSALISEAFGESTRSDTPATRSSGRRSEEPEYESADESNMAEEDGVGLAEEDEGDLEELFSAVMTAKEGDREISAMFQLLPSRTKYPEYYKVIKDPIDLKAIAERIQNSLYTALDELEKDLLLMVKNAKLFNEPGSQIYKDAVALKKVIGTKKIELDHKRSGAMKTSERIRTREKSTGQRLSAIVAALKSEEEKEVPKVVENNDSLLEYEEDSGGETTVSEEENLNWALFNYVKSYKNSLGSVLAEPFLKLPSRRFYSDYYEEIKNPMSLFNVRKKLKHNQYSCLDDLASDLDLVFDNAQQYNQDGSRLFKSNLSLSKDAQCLQKVMHEKKKELEKYDVKDFPLEELPPIYDCPLVHKLERDSWDEDESTCSSFKMKSNKNRKSFIDTKNKTPAKKAFEDSIKKRLTMLYKAAFDYTDTNGRPLRDIFMMLPLKKDYPDYYQVISHPIDMNMIDQRIKNDKYTTEQQLLTDFELLFNNARHYNEEGSVVYQDAETLDKVVRNKWKSMNPAFDSPKSKPKVKPVSLLCQKLTELYNTIKDYTDSRGRLLSTPFIKLPLKSEYPDYYEVIKKPVDMQRVQQRMSGSQYETVEDMVADFVQMFDNACKYNEPDSLIYKDALTLQRICLEKKAELTADGNGNEVPDVRAIVQELMTNLFIATYNYQDEEGRCYSDSFAEIPEKDPEDEEEGPKMGKPLTFDQIKRNLDKGRYRRVDRFQEDMFKVFERARKLSRTDSQVYEDSVEMQMFFIKQRDEVCKNGEILLTPALSYTEKHLQTALDTEKKEKLPREQKEDEEKKKQTEEMDGKPGVQGTPEEDGEDSVSFQEETFHVGEFVYVEPRETSLEPHIMCIERLFKDSTGEQMLYGNWFYRPNETYHLATRKFLEKEVFKSDFFTQVPLSHVIGKCYVMFVKDYFKQKPEGFEDKDVYVSEFRYTARHKAFKKIKIWQVPRNDTVKIVTRDIPLVPVRVASVFAEKGKSEEKDDLDDGETHILDKVRINVPVEAVNPVEDGLSHYEQYNIPAGAFKIGDCVYVRSSDNRPLIAKIDKIWTDQAGNPFFCGPWFVRPMDVEHAPTRLFYKREVFLSSIEDTNPLYSIMAKCSVLHIKEYLSSRVIEIPEHDVFVCESKYLEAEKSIRKLPKGFKQKCTLSPKVTDDEVYFFKKPIVPRKQEPSPLLAKASAEEPYVEMEIIPETVEEPLADPANVSIEEPQTPQPEKSAKKKSSVKRVPSGYIVFAGEVRKTCQQENPDSSFGDISRIVGTKWRSLPKEDKERYEEKAKRIAEEQAAKQQEADRAFNESLSQNRSQSPWSDYGKSMSPSGNSRPATPGYAPMAHGYSQGYPSPGYPNQPGYSPAPGYPPQGYSMPQGYAPFPGARPMMPGPHPMGQGVQQPHMAPGPRGMPGFYPPSTSVSQSHPPPTSRPLVSPYLGMCTPSPFPTFPNPYSMAMAPSFLNPNGDGHPLRFLPHHHNDKSTSGQHLPTLPPPRPPSPMFVPVPQRTQRLLHSEAYIRYIENLSSDSNTVGDFDRSLAATQENTQPKSTTQLPTQWLGQGAGYHDSVVTALWALRDLMMKDTLNVQRTLSFDQLCFSLKLV